ncbi:MAG TPA: hypothetical protein VGE07_21390 [Herpetosiphonaceae bacterium]
MRSRLLLLAPLLALGWTIAGAGSPLGAAPARQAAPDPVKYIDVTVSLEWQPGAADKLPDDLALAGCAPGAATEDRYLDDLKNAMRAFSKYLYQATEGQAALREVKVHPGGVNWDSADIRILAGASAQPLAFVGGAVDAPTPFSPRPGLSFMAYPRGIILGRLWNGATARCGAWSAPAGWRTLGHEWAHHEFYLWDEYFNYFTQAEQFCSSTGMSPPARVGGAAPSPLADSLMAYQYGAGKFWLKPSPMPPGCAETPQQVLNQGSDWQTIARFHPALTPPAASTPGPDFEASAAATAFRFEVVAPAAPADASAPLRLEVPAASSLTANGYVILDGPSGPQRIIGQGELLPGETRAFWGAAGGRAALDLHNWRTGERRAYPAGYAAPPPLDPAKLNLAAPAATTWRPAFALTPILSSNQIPGATEVAGLKVAVSECTRSAQQIIELGYCPAGGPCSALESVPIGPGDRFEHTFSFPVDGQVAPPADSGYLYARNAATGEEAVAWYQFGGGVGPAHTIGHTPLLDGAVTVSLPHGSSLPPTADTQVIYSNAQLCPLVPPFLEPPALGIASGPIAIQVVRSDRAGAGWGTNDPPLNIRLSYDEDLVNRQGIAEEQLVVLRLNGGKWAPVSEIGRSKALDWIAIAPQPFAGEGQIFAFGYVAQKTALPLLGR